VAVAAIGLALSWALAGSPPRRRGRAEALTDWIEVIPPLAWGVGALSLPSLAGLGADLLGGSGGHNAVAGALGRLADILDPDRTPGVLLVVAVVASRFPMLARWAVRSRDVSRRAPRDAALSLGVSPRRARRMASGGALGASAGPLALIVALAVTSLTPALLLTPTLETRTVAPGVLILADEPGGGLARAAALAIAAIVVNLIALAAAAWGRSRPIGAWFRG
jgi:iron(III) transport system permease protein